MEEKQLCCFDGWRVGLGGSRLPPSEREEEQSSLGRPLGRGQRTAATTNEYRRALALRPPRAGKRRRWPKRKLSGPPFRASPEN